MRTGFTLIKKATGEIELVISPSSLVTFAQNKIAVVVIGQIYYQDELKYSSDAELVLALVEAHGYKILEQLEGEFALAIFEPQQNRLLAMRDPLGSWPLYWVNEGGNLWLGTNLQLIAQKIPQASVNLDFMASFLAFPYPAVELDTQQTALQPIQRILPGTIVAFTSDDHAQIIWSWEWQNKIEDRSEIELEEASREFRRLFEQAVQQRIKRGKIAAHLSGGMDSSSIVGVARQFLAQRADNLITLSLIYDMSSLAGEKDYIRLVIEQGGAITPQYLPGDTAVDFQWFESDFPNHDEPYSSLYRLALEKILVDSASQLGVNTILSGIGAEILVEGYRVYLADLLLQGKWHFCLSEASKWAQFKNTSLWSILKQFALDPLLPPLWRSGLGLVLRGGYGSWPKLGLFTIPPWVNPDFVRSYHLKEKLLANCHQLRRYPIEQSYNLMALKVATGNWSSWYLGAPLGIQTVQPFLDTRLITYCLGLSYRLKQIPGKHKPLLGLAMADILPQPILNRKFKVTFDEIYWNGLSQNLPFLEEMIEQCDDLGIFDKSQLLEVMNQHSIGIGDFKSGIPLATSLAAIAWLNQTKKVLATTVQLPPGITLGVIT